MTIGEAAWKIYSQSGFLGFYYGLMPTVVRSFPSTAVLFLIYDEVFSLLHNE